MMCYFFFHHLRSQAVRVLSGNRIPSLERDFNNGIIYGRAGKVISRGWWSPGNKKGQKTLLSQPLKGQEEETVTRPEPVWAGVMEGGRPCRSLVCSSLAVGKETPDLSPSYPPIFSSSLWFAVSASIFWIQLVTEWRGHRSQPAWGRGEAETGKGWVWVGSKWEGQWITTSMIRISNSMQI